MKNTIIGIIIGITLIVGVNSLKPAVGGNLIQNAPIYTTASSTNYALGNQVSTKVLDAAYDRAYARICNDTANTVSQDIYLSFSSTAITATTSADTIVENNSCYEIDNDNLYIGEVQILTGTGSTTAVFVTEFRD